MISSMRISRSPWGRIELTDERKRHVIFFHPEIASVLPHFSLTIAHPEKIIHSTNDDKVIICYRFLPNRRKYLAIVIKLKPKSNFVLTAYLTRKIKQTP